MTTLPNNQTKRTLDELAKASQRRAGEANTPFPVTWDPGNPDHPNPIVMVAFPPMQKPEGRDPLVEAQHSDGVRYTIWIGASLFSALDRAGVREGQPCAIQRSETKHRFFSNKLGRDVDGWGWTVTTPQTAELPAKGGRIIGFDEARAAFGDDSKAVLEGTVELEPDAIEVASVSSDDIPF